jgi:hypothetical protein
MAELRPGAGWYNQPATAASSPGPLPGGDAAPYHYTRPLNAFATGGRPRSSAAGGSAGRGTVYSAKPAPPPPCGRRGSGSARRPRHDTLADRDGPERLPAPLFRTGRGRGFALEWPKVGRRGRRAGGAFERRFPAPISRETRATIPARGTSLTRSRPTRQRPRTREGGSSGGRPGPDQVRDGLTGEGC